MLICQNMETLTRRWFQKKNNQKILSSKLGFVWQQLFSCLFNFLFSSLHQQTGKFRFFILHRISVLHIYLYFFIWKYIWGNERLWLPAYWAGKECFYIPYLSIFYIYFYKCFFILNFETFRPGHILGNGGCGCLLPEAVKAWGLSEWGSSPASEKCAALRGGRVLFF